MSWRINASGTSQAVQQAVDVEANNLPPDAKEGFAAIKPQVDALIASQGMDKIKLSTTGHETVDHTTGQKHYSYLSIVIEGTNDPMKPAAAAPIVKQSNDTE